MLGPQKYQKVCALLPGNGGDHAAGPRPRGHARLQNGRKKQADRGRNFFERRARVPCWRIRRDSSLATSRRERNSRSRYWKRTLRAGPKANSPDIREIDPNALAESASRKAAESREPREIPAGPLHRDPRAVRGPRSGRVSLLRFCGHGHARQALVLHRPHGQEDFRREHHVVGRRLSSAANRPALRRRGPAAAESVAGRSRRAEESGLRARDREKNESEANRPRLFAAERIRRSADESRFRGRRQIGRRDGRAPPSAASSSRASGTSAKWIPTKKSSPA